MRNKSDCHSKTHPQSLDKIVTIYVCMYVCVFVCVYVYIYMHIGRATAEAVGRWLPTAADRVRARVWQVRFVVDKVASGKVFSECFGFPCQNH
jgi:hypothetical protein